MLSRSLQSFSLVLLVSWGTACGTANTADSVALDPEDWSRPPAIGTSFQAISFTGDSLFSNTTEALVATHGPLLEEALEARRSDPANPDPLIWIGRRHAYMGDYQKAIEVFSAGIEAFPNDPRFYRHRAHRYISTRQLDKAITDWAIAAKKIEGTEDGLEPDGLPNARGIPISTLHHNIWYHYALSHFLKGEYQQALVYFQNCLDSSANPDSMVAASYWLYMTHVLLGQVDEAEAVLASISADMDMIENQSYLDLLLLFKGEKAIDEVVPTDGESLVAATTMYGVANWHRFNGRNAEADEVVTRAFAAKTQWASFGYVAVEAEMARR